MPPVSPEKPLIIADLSRSYQMGQNDLNSSHGPEEILLQFSGVHNPPLQVDIQSEGDPDEETGLYIPPTIMAFAHLETKRFPSTYYSLMVEEPDRTHEAIETDSPPSLVDHIGTRLESPPIVSSESVNAEAMDEDGSDSHWRANTAFPVHDELLLIADPEDNLGAEVVCGESDGVVPQLPAWSRRISYEEMIHPEPEEPAMVRIDESLESCMSVLTLWALSLQEIHDERSDSHLRPESTNCVCAKARALVQGLRVVEEHFLDTLTLNERIAEVHFHIVKARISELRRLLWRMHESLRAHVSIQVALPRRDFVERADYLVATVHDSCRYVNDAIESIIDLVDKLLQVDTCSHAGELTEDDPSSGDMDGLTTRDAVESLLHGSGETVIRESRIRIEIMEEEQFPDEVKDTPPEEDEDKENQPNRKRKTAKFAPKEPHTSPTSSPRKKARNARNSESTSHPASPGADDTIAVIAVLESSRKAARKDGLYQFVLWREALKAARRSLPESIPPTPIVPRSPTSCRALSSA